MIEVGLSSDDPDDLIESGSVTVCLSSAYTPTALVADQLKAHTLTFVQGEISADIGPMPHENLKKIARLITDYAYEVEDKLKELV